MQDEYGIKDRIETLGCVYELNMKRMEEKDADIKFLAERNLRSGIDCMDERETGLSSDSIVAIAYGTLPPEKQILPSDKSDLMACERMWKKLPQHRKTASVIQAMERARRFKKV